MKGVGNDIIEIDRIRESLERHGSAFLERLFSSREQAYCLTFQDPAPHVAGRFAAKEAVVKALGTGFGHEVGWHDFEILAEESGKPYVHCSEKLQKRFGSPRIFISISHSKSHAIAIALWVD